MWSRKGPPVPGKLGICLRCHQSPESIGSLGAICSIFCKLLPPSTSSNTFCRERVGAQTKRKEANLHLTSSRQPAVSPGGKIPRPPILLCVCEKERKKKEHHLQSISRPRRGRIVVKGPWAFYTRGKVIYVHRIHRKVHPEYVSTNWFKYIEACALL